MIENKRLISIIIPCYNAEKTIIRTLESVENQSYKNYEVIIIDDGSKDETEKKIINYINGKQRFIFLKQKNKGVSAARNYGLTNAKGEYIAFIDADDVYNPLFLETLLNKIEETALDLICSQYKLVHMNDNLNEKYCEAYIHEKKMSKRELLECYMRKRIYKFSFCNILYRSNIIFDFNILFDETLRYGEDSLFLGEYLAHANNGGIFLYQELYGYTINVNSAMHKRVSWENAENIEAMKRIVEYWRKCGLDTDFSEYMISRAVWGMAKDFASDDELFAKLQKVYDVKKAMHVMKKKCDEVSVRLLAIIFLINVNLYRVILMSYQKGRQYSE